MITIKIKNSAQIVKQKKGRLAAGVGRFFNLEKIVEQKVVKEIEEVFKKHGIDADITIE